jgi:hypothetical protein
MFFQAIGVRKVWNNLSHLVSNKKALPFLARHIPLVPYTSYLPGFTPNPYMAQKWNVTMGVAYQFRILETGIVSVLTHVGGG